MEYVKIKGNFSLTRTYEQALELVNHNIDDNCELSLFFVQVTDLPEDLKKYLPEQIKNDENIFIGYGQGQYSLKQSNGQWDIIYSVIAKKLDDDSYFALFTDGEILNFNIMYEGNNLINSTNVNIFTKDDSEGLFTDYISIGNAEKIVMQVDKDNEEAIEAAEAFCGLIENNAIIPFAELIVENKYYEQFIIEDSKFYEKALKENKLDLFIPKVENEYIFRINFYDFLMSVYVDYCECKEKFLKEKGKDAFDYDKAEQIINISINNYFETIDNDFMNKFHQTMSNEQKDLYRKYLKNCYDFYDKEEEYYTKNDYITRFDDKSVGWGRLIYRYAANDIQLRELMYESLSDLFIYGIEEDYGIDSKKQTIYNLMNLECELEDTGTKDDSDDAKEILQEFLTNMLQTQPDQDKASEDEKFISSLEEYIFIFRSLKSYYKLSNEELYIKLEAIASEFEKDEANYFDTEHIVL